MGQPGPERPDDFAPAAVYGLDDLDAEDDEDDELTRDRRDDAGDLHDDGEDVDDVGLGRPLYQGTGLSVRALSPEELAQFLAAHHGHPARLVGRGWQHLQAGGVAVPGS